MQWPHHVVQKLRTMILPLKEAMFKGIAFFQPDTSSDGAGSTRLLIFSLGTSNKSLPLELLVVLPESNERISGFVNAIVVTNEMAKATNSKNEGFMTTPLGI